MRLLRITLVAASVFSMASISPSDEVGNGRKHDANPMVGTHAGQVRDDNELKLKFAWCPPGKFTAGSPKSESSRRENENQVEIKMSYGFWLGQTEVTQGLWQKLMQSTPWKGIPHVEEGASDPATQVAYLDVMKFCRKLTALERAAGRLPSSREYTLPSELQWEYACRAGATTAYSFGNDPAELIDYAWWGGERSDGNVGAEQYAHQVGLQKPDPWSLYDMHGNVWELCRDSWAAQIGGHPEPLRFPAKALGRIARGGSWRDGASNCRSARRRKVSPGDLGYDDVGFRVALIFHEAGVTE
jgi:formylglycine-generating enzyme required for sulfatase activity